MDSNANKQLGKTKGGTLEKHTHFPNMLWLHRDRLARNRARASGCDLMDRVRAFLPQIATANKKLEEAVLENPNSFDIENIDDCKDSVIEMNVALVPETDSSDLEDEEIIDSDVSDDSYSSSDSSDSDCDKIALRLKSDRKRRSGRSIVELIPGPNCELQDAAKDCNGCNTVEEAEIVKSKQTKESKQTDELKNDAASF